MRLPVAGLGKGASLITTGPTKELLRGSPQPQLRAALREVAFPLLRSSLADSRYSAYRALLSFQVYCLLRPEGIRGGSHSLSATIEPESAARSI
jgi:hypothetical protein